MIKLIFLVFAPTKIKVDPWRPFWISVKPWKFFAHTKNFEVDLWRTFWISVASLNKSTLDNSPPPNYDKESKDECHHANNNPRYKWYVKPAAFQVIAPTRSNYGRKINVKNRNKSTILIFLPAIIELVQELLISNMHNKLEEDTCENVEVIAPTRSNYWRKMRKIAINRPLWIFFQPLLNMSKNYLLVTCITNLKRICEKLFKLSRPQGQIIDVKWEKSQ